MKKLLIALILIMGVATPASAQLFNELFGTQRHKKLTLKEGQHYVATIYTSKGNVVVKLFNETPKHRDNFVKLAQSDFFTGILFHRVIKDFMIQAGDPSSRESSQVKTYGGNDAGYKIDAEILPQFFHKKGVLAAAREGDDVNPEKKSSGSQFFIVTGKVLADSTMEEIKEKIKFRKSWEMTPEREKIYRTVGGAPHLDGNYTIFGEVVSGQPIVDRISKTPTYKNDRPKEDIYIKKVIINLAADKKKKK